MLSPNNTANNSFNSFYFNNYRSHGPFVRRAADRIVDRGVRLTEGNHTGELYDATVAELELQERARFANVPDQLSRVILQHGSLLGPARSGSPVFEPNFDSTTLPQQLVRHTGLSPTNIDFRRLQSFIRQRGLNPNANGLRDGYFHYVVVVDLQRGNSDVADRPVLVSYFTLTHTAQSVLDRRNLGSGSLPNLQLVTLSRGADLAGGTIDQQMLANAIIAPRSSLNLELNPSGATTIFQNINASLPSMTHLFAGGNLGRPYVLLARESHYRALVDFLHTTEAHPSLARSVEQDFAALQRNEPNVDVQQQIVAMELLRQAQSPGDTEEVLAMADSYRNSLFNDSNS